MVDLPPFRKCLALCIHFVQMEIVCRAQTIQALKMPRFHPYFLQMSKIKFKKQVKKKNERRLPLLTKSFDISIRLRCASMQPVLLSVEQTVEGKKKKTIAFSCEKNFCKVIGVFFFAPSPQLVSLRFLYGLSSGSVSLFFLFRHLIV